MKIVSPTCSVGIQAWLVQLQWVILEKEYMKHNRGKNIVKIVKIMKIGTRKLKI